MLTYLLSITVYGDMQSISPKEYIWDGPHCHPSLIKVKKGPIDLHINGENEPELLSQGNLHSDLTLTLVPLRTCGKLFSTGTGITPPPSHMGGVWDYSNDWRMPLAINGQGHRCQMSCQRQECPVQPRIVPPNTQQAPPLRTLPPSGSLIVRIVVSIPSFQAEGEVEVRCYK